MTNGDFTVESLVTRFRIVSEIPHIQFNGDITLFVVLT